jgi:hypothetical protein
MAVSQILKMLLCSILLVVGAVVRQRTYSTRISGACLPMGPLSETPRPPVPDLREVATDEISLASGFAVSSRTTLRAPQMNRTRVGKMWIIKSLRAKTMACTTSMAILPGDEPRELMIRAASVRRKTFACDINASLKQSESQLTRYRTRALIAKPCDSEGDIVPVNRVTRTSRQCTTTLPEPAASTLYCYASTYLAAGPRATRL